MFLTRLISGIILLIVAGIAIVLGNDVLFTVILIISLIGLYELYRLLNMQKKLPGIVGYLAAVGYFVIVRTGLEEHFAYFSLALMIALLAVYVFSFPTYKTEEILMAFFGVFYVPVMLSYVYKTRMLDNGILIIWLIFISSWVNDTCAYCVGMLTAKTIGNHKMAPKLSPKKSIEGAIGGIAGAFLIGMLFGSLAGESLLGMSHPAISCALLCAAGSVISVIGDLAASAIKRNYGIKDFGKLIPGHGGILDRFDSVIFTAPVTCFLAELIVPML